MSNSGPADEIPDQRMQHFMQNIYPEICKSFTRFGSAGSALPMLPRLQLLNVMIQKL